MHQDRYQLDDFLSWLRIDLRRSRWNEYGIDLSWSDRLFEINADDLLLCGAFVRVEIMDVLVHTFLQQCREDTTVYLYSSSVIALHIAWQF